MNRPGDITNPQRAKDLLYLRDLMAAGEDVASTIEKDLRRLVTEHAFARSELRTARNNLRLALDGALQEAVFEASLAAAERLRVDPGVATRDRQGHLADVVELVEAGRASRTRAGWWSRPGSRSPARSPPRSSTP